MADFLTRWTVEPHDEIARIDDGLLTVAGDMHMRLGRLPRRMTVARLAAGGTAIWSAIALREPDMARIEALGRPTWLIVPGIAHRRDARIWKDRYPAMKVLCPAGAAKAVAEAVPVDATTDPFGDSAVRFETVPGLAEVEAALLVRRAGRLSLIVNDILANVRHPHGLGARAMTRLFGFGRLRPQIPRIVRRRFVKDASALAAAFRRWAQQPDLVRIVPSHGDVIEDEPRAVLTRIASTLEH